MSQCEECQIRLCRMTVVSIASSFAYDFLVASSASSGQKRSRPQELMGPWSEVSFTQLKMSLFSMTFRRIPAASFIRCMRGLPDALQDC